MVTAVSGLIGQLDHGELDPVSAVQGWRAHDNLDVGVRSDSRCLQCRGHLLNLLVIGVSDKVKLVELEVESLAHFFFEAPHGVCSLQAYLDVEEEALEVILNVVHADCDALSLLRELLMPIVGFDPSPVLASLAIKHLAVVNLADVADNFGLPPGHIIVFRTC